MMYKYYINNICVVLMQKPLILTTTIDVDLVPPGLTKNCVCVSCPTVGSLRIDTIQLCTLNQDVSFSETRAPLSPMIHHHIRYWNCYLKGILNNKAKDHPVDFVSHSIPFKPQYTLLYPMSSLLFSLDPVTIFRHTHISYQLGWLYLHHSTWLVHHILPIGE